MSKPRLGYTLHLPNGETRFLEQKNLLRTVPSKLPTLSAEQTPAFLDPTNFPAGRNEGSEHQSIKRHFQDIFAAKGLGVVIEVPLGIRRADLMVLLPNETFLAIEFQRSSISMDKIADRAESYASRNITQMWIPFLRERPIQTTSLERKIFEINPQTPVPTHRIPHYPIKPFERWIHGLYGRHGMWMFDPQRGEMWRGTLKSCGGENCNHRCKTLYLEGPYRLADLDIRISYRKEFKTTYERWTNYRWPAGPIAWFTAWGG